jgi:Zn-dependent protease with chaperone function
MNAVMTSPEPTVLVSIADTALKPKDEPTFNFVRVYQSEQNGTGVLGMWYDGISAVPREVLLRISNGIAYIQTLENTTETSAIAYSEPIKKINFGYATQQGVRLISFSNAAQFQANHTAELNEYLNTFKIHHNWIDTLSLKWRWVILSAILTIGILFSAYQWGIPFGAKIAAPLMPNFIKQMLGDTALKTLDQHVFKPSSLPLIQQQAVQNNWRRALKLAYPNQDYPKHTVVFRKMPSLRHSDQSVANAMALPNGTIVVTDGLVQLLNDKPNAITGVLAHELGHLEHHHNMRAFLEFSSLSAISAIILGDYTLWINQLPIFIGQMQYSRAHESEADDAAIKIMQSAHINPAELALFFERVSQAAFNEKTSTQTPSTPQTCQNPNNTSTNTADDIFTDWFKTISLPDILDSHPSSEARMKKLRAAGIHPN